MPFHFLDPGPLIDRELELIPPDARWIDEVLRTTAHPAGKNDPTARTTRQQIEDYLRAAPGGHYLPTTGESRVPQYQFWMRLKPVVSEVEGSEYSPPVVIAGSVGVRIGDSHDLRTYLGHLGYNVFPAARGQHYAERSCRLLLDLARRHGMKELWITCNPDNLASRRTCERLGATFEGIVPLPPAHILYQRGERQKCRYHLPL
jgi:tagatose 1,6-diphosphate aldolase